MKKALFCFFLLASSALSAGAQILHIGQSGEPIPERYGTRINETLLEEVRFYGPLITQDTVNLELKVFKDLDACNAFLRQSNPLAYTKNYSGMFLPDMETAVLTINDDMDRAVKVLFHEVSHSLYDKALKTSAEAYSLNEGLACYFEFLNVRKDGTTVQRPDRLYISSVKTLVEIGDFNLDEYLDMTYSEFTDKSNNDGHISYHVSYVIVATLFRQMGAQQMQKLLAMIRSGASYKDSVEALYPGGRSALEEDIISFVRK